MQGVFIKQGCQGPSANNEFSSHKFKLLILSNVINLKEIDFFINEDYSKEKQWQSEKKNRRKLDNYENSVNMQSLFMVRWCGEKKDRQIKRANQSRIFSCFLELRYLEFCLLLYKYMNNFTERENLKNLVFFLFLQRIFYLMKMLIQLFNFSSNYQRFKQTF